MNPRTLNRKLTLVALGASLLPFTSLAAQTVEPQFEAQVIDDQVSIGYGVAAGDVDGDGRVDLLLADQKAFVWYRNPDWKRFEIIRDLTPLDNVCIAARDIDGDGRVEIAVGAMWNPGDTLDSGSVHYLIPQEDRTLPWTAIKLPHEPTTHRMRWVRRGDQTFVLVVAPLHGRGNRNGEGDGVKIQAYEPGSDPEQPWSITTIDDSLHQTHNFEPFAASNDSAAESLLIVGREGARLARWTDNAWHVETIDRIEGSGEVRVGQTADGNGFVATVEAMHGDRLVVYPLAGNLDAQRWIASDRIVLDDQLSAGHAVVIGDLLGTGSDQVVVGWRLPNSAGEIGIKLFQQDAQGVWQGSWIDQGGMATEDAMVVDLDQDGDLEIVAAGRATNNLKVYWNRASQ